MNPLPLRFSSLLLLFACSCSPVSEPSPPIRDSVDWAEPWSEFHSLLGQPIDAPPVEEFVAKHRLKQYTKGDSGGFYGELPFRLSYSQNRISRVIVIIGRAVDAEGTGPLFQGDLPFGLVRDDLPEDAIRKIGTPTLGLERGYLSYPAKGLVVSFGRNDNRLYEIYLDFVP